MNITTTIKNIIGDFKGYGSCPHCNDSWYWKEILHIQYDVNLPQLSSNSILPVCKECFDKLSPSMIAYYGVLLLNSAEFEDTIRENVQLMKLEFVNKKLRELNTE